MSTKRGNPLTKAERLCVHVCVCIKISSTLFANAVGVSGEVDIKAVVKTLDGA